MIKQVILKVRLFVALKDLIFKSQTFYNEGLEDLSRKNDEGSRGVPALYRGGCRPIVWLLSSMGSVPNGANLRAVWDKISVSGVGVSELFAKS
jgi:hypothetical protein